MIILMEGLVQASQDACKETENSRRDLQARIALATGQLEDVRAIKTDAPKPYVKGLVFCTHCRCQGHYNARSDACVLHAAYTSAVGESRERQDGVFGLPALENDKRKRPPPSASSASGSKARLK